MLQHQPSRTVSTEAQQKLTLWMAGSGKEANKDEKQEEGGDSDDDGGLLRRKAFSILRPEVKTKLEASGKKILEVISNDEEDSSDEEEEMQKGGDRVVEQASLKNALAKVCMTTVADSVRVQHRSIFSHCMRR